MRRLPSPMRVWPPLAIIVVVVAFVGIGLQLSGAGNRAPGFGAPGGTATAPLGSPVPALVPPTGELDTAPGAATSPGALPPETTDPSQLPSTPRPMVGAAWVPVASDAFGDGSIVNAMGSTPDGMIVAVGAICTRPDDPTTCRAATWLSKDGTFWESRPAPGGVGQADLRPLRSVLSWSGGFLAVSTREDGPKGIARVVFTKDMVDWPSLGAIAGDVRSLASGGSGVIAVGSELTGDANGPEAPAAWVSVDGVDWRPMPIPLQDGSGVGEPVSPGTLDRLVDVVAGPLGTVAGGSSCGGAVCRAELLALGSDGVWVHQDTSTAGFLGQVNAVSAGAGGYVAVGTTSQAPGRAIAWYSLHGSAWQASATTDDPAVSMDAVSWLGDRFLAMGRNADGTIAAWVSVDGASWDPVTQPEASGTPTSILDHDGAVIAARSDAGRTPAGVLVGRLRP